MKSLKKEVTLHLVAFSSGNYWKAEDQKHYAGLMLAEIGAKIETAGVKYDKIIITGDEEIGKLGESGFSGTEPALFFPMSGATQAMMLKSALFFDVLGICITYTDFFINRNLANKMLVKNAAPATMDIYAVLKRQKRHLSLVTDLNNALKLYHAKLALERMKNATLLRIGETEPWVISATKDSNLIKAKLGVKVVSITQSALEEEYKKITGDEVAERAEEWIHPVRHIHGIDKNDVVKALRVSKAVELLAERHDADAVSIACFNLLGLIGTTACLAVSELNESEYMVGGCEGDVDLALTLMLMKALTGKPGWAANPMIEHNDLLRLAHCTAPRYKNKYRYDLMKHHESGIGVSPKIIMPNLEKITLARLGNELSALNIFTGVTLDSHSVETCRTQVMVKLDEFSAYKEKVLGCHQVLTFGDYSQELYLISDMLGLQS